MAPPTEAVSEAAPPLPDLELGVAADELVVPELEEPPIVVDTNVVDGNLDVLSPETEEPAAPSDTAVDVISPALEADITPDPAPVAAPAEAIELETALPPAPDVSVPDLNPLESAPAGEIGEAPAAPETVAGSDLAEALQPDETPRPDAHVDAPDDSAQYHSEISRYQYEEIPEPDSWTWEWYLVLDCEGVTSSTSTELGDSASESWAWIWNWTWNCGFDGASEESADALDEGFSSIASVNGPTTVTSSPGATGGADPSQATGDPWLWTWTFSFCGREHTFSISAGAETSLQWTWDWTWTWACTSEPAIGGEGPGGPAADEGPEPGTLELPPSPSASSILLPTVSEALTVLTPLLPAPSVAIEAPISAVIPLGSPSLPLPKIGFGPVAIPPTGPGRVPAPVAAAAPGITTTAAAAAPSDQDEGVRARQSKPRDRSAAPGPALPPELPLGPARRAAGSTSSGGTAPGGTGAAGTAALTAFYVLAAPGLGRRLREARELSPRTRYYAPLDRPG